MSSWAIVVGIVTAVYFVMQFRVTSLEKMNRAYPLLLATFPIYYWVFAIYASDDNALVNEVAIGIGFLCIAYLSYKLNNFIGLLLLAFGYIGHAVYDAIHSSLFHNQGTPFWWPEFCGSVDALIGLYLVFFALSMRRKHAKTA